MVRKISTYWIIGLVLVGIPFTWMLLDRTWTEGRGIFTPIDTLITNAFFNVRKLPENPVKVVYITLDEDTLEEMGGIIVDPELFASVAQAVFKEGKAKALGIDVLFNNREWHSKFFDNEKLRGRELVWGQTIQDYPSIVLSCEYSSEPLEVKWEGFSYKTGPFPYMNLRGYNLQSNPYPEMPTYPVIGTGWGRMGLNISLSDRSSGSTPSWVPMLTEYRGVAESVNILKGISAFYNVPASNILQKKENFILLDKENKVLFTLPIKSQRTFYHMGIELVLAYHGLDAKHVIHIENGLKIVDDSEKTLHTIPLNEKQFLEINWFSKWDNKVSPICFSLKEFLKYAKNLGATDVQLKDQAREFFLRFEDAIVIVGSESDNLISTPLDKELVPNISATGNLVKTIFSGQYIYRLPGLWDIVILFGVSFIFGFLGFYNGKHAILFRVLPLPFLVLFVYGCYVLFACCLIRIHFSAPIISGITTLLVAMTVQLILESKKRNQLHALFDSYVSPTLVKEMLEKGKGPQLGGVESEISAMFCDIQQFGNLSEALSPQQLVQVMNEYFTAMTVALTQAGGTLDKYIGDAIVGIFGAPLPVEHHALQSCLAAIELQKTQTALRQKWLQDKPHWPSIIHGMCTRIGINSGKAIVGNIGSQIRFTYTMMGDEVNLAARCEKSAADYGVFTLITEETKKAAEKFSDVCVFRFINRTLVRGHHIPVNFYEIVGVRSELETQKWDCLEFYNKGVAAYFKREWDLAIHAFEKSAKLEVVSSLQEPTVLNASTAFIARCQYFKETPPAPS